MKTRTILAFAVGPIATAVLGALSVPAMAWVFTPEDVGRLNVLQVVVSFAVLLLALGLDQAYVREFHVTEKRASLLWSTFLPGAVLLAVAAAVALAMADRFAIWLYGVPNTSYFWITFLCVVIAYVSRFLSLILRMNERGLLFSVSQVVPKLVLVALIGVVALMRSPSDFLHLALVFLSSTATALLVLAWSTGADIRSAVHTTFDKKWVAELLRYSVPLMLAALSYWGLSATSTFALRSLSSFAELGVYSITVRVAGVAMVVQAIFSMIWAPVVYKWAASDADMSRVGWLSRQALAVVVGIFVLCGSFAWVIDYVLPPEYIQVKYLVVGAIAQPMLYMLSEMSGIGIGITRRTTLSLWAALVALIVNLVLNLILVPRFGASGAVVSNAIGYLIFFTARTEASAFVWRSFARGKTYGFVIGVVALAVANVIAGPSLGVAFSLVWVAAAPITIWAFRTEWRELARNLRSLKQRSGSTTE